MQRQTGFTLVDHRAAKRGFTLVELSIVLVIIGLIIGGVLVGQDLIGAALIRAQISQIEKYQGAVNTFRSKYGYLPGDIPNPVAGQYGFTTRGNCSGMGDGDGTLQGITAACPTPNNIGEYITSGETGQFWVDLSAAKLVDGGFSTANLITTAPTITTQAQIDRLLPAARIGLGNYVYVWSGGWRNVDGGAPGDSVNYFGVAGMIPNSSNSYMPDVVPRMTPVQAYNIDKKLDDGLPQYGKVTAQWAQSVYGNYTGWASGPISGGGYGGDSDNVTCGPITDPSGIGNGCEGDGAVAGFYSCFDGSTGLPEKYSLQIDGGRDQNCALSFKFQ